LYVNKYEFAHQVGD